MRSTGRLGFTAFPVLSPQTAKIKETEMKERIE
jgi:hypothetical protein